ncbi:MAG: cobyrinate a,c-diamide synthase, partial [Cytophagales bacterium]|nr:cobyrinate a,c-diamide synthase [Cytophagales bacterium]
MPRAIFIGGTGSHVGKTCFTLGWARYLREQGEQVQVFKVGPDYLDPHHHVLATGRPCINLDMVMMSSSHIRDLLGHYGLGASVILVEGMMGLFDGSRKSEASSAALSKLLEMGVWLLFPGAALSHTAAALLKGMKDFDPLVQYEGVIFNYVSSLRHANLLDQAASTAGIPFLGALPSDGSMSLPSRHLGLALDEGTEDRIHQMASHIGSSLDTENLWHAMPSYSLPALRRRHKLSLAYGSPKRKILIARDEAFSFLYEANVQRLRDLGSLQFFSPLRDRVIPEGTDLLYFPGGYPELYARELSGNWQLKEALQRYHAGGGHIFGECGGAMYLGQGFQDENQKNHAMVGIFSFQTKMIPRGMYLGYRRIRASWGKEIWGHEFHYSHLVEVESGEWVDWDV